MEQRVAQVEVDLQYQDLVLEQLIQEVELLVQLILQLQLVDLELF
jgi:hypothetical protein